MARPSERKVTRALAALEADPPPLTAVPCVGQITLAARSAMVICASAASGGRSSEAGQMARRIRRESPAFEATRVTA